PRRRGGPDARAWSTPLGAASRRPRARLRRAALYVRRPRPAARRRRATPVGRVPRARARGAAVARRRVARRLRPLPVGGSSRRAAREPRDRDPAEAEALGRSERGPPGEGSRDVRRLADAVGCDPGARALRALVRGGADR